MAQDSPHVIAPDRDYLSGLYVRTLIIFALFILPWVLLGLVPELGWGYVVVFLVANAVWMAVAFILYPVYYRSISYELKEDEIVVHKGIITHSVQVVPYRTVTNLTLARDPVDRLLGTGTVKVETAGKSGQSGPEASLVGLKDYDFVHNLLRERLRRYHALSSATTAEAAQTSALPAWEETLQQLLAEVHEIKEIMKRR